MRKAFHQYFRLTDSELSDLWANGLFSFDASVLLNIYGYSSDTREDLVKAVEQNAERVRLPHQFGLEYARNRSSVILRQVSNYLKAEKALKEIRDQHIAPKRDHPYLCKSSLDAYGAIQQELIASRRVIEKLVGSDPYADKMLAVFEGRVSKEPSAEELAQMHVESQQRFDRQIPPGYMDLKDKGIPDAYGDCVGWLQLLQISNSEHRGIIFVVDDFKEDWWQIERERTIGPRPELLEEFTRVTGQRMCMYTSENFLRAARKFVAADISDAVIEEVTERLADLRKFERPDNPKPTSPVGELPTTTDPIRTNEDKPSRPEKPVDFAAGHTDKPDASPEGGQ